MAPAPCPDCRVGLGWCSPIPEPGSQPFIPCQQSLQPPLPTTQRGARFLPLPGAFPALKCILRPAQVFPTGRSVHGHRAMDARSREEAWLQHPPPAASPAEQSPHPAAQEAPKWGIWSFIHLPGLHQEEPVRAHTEIIPRVLPAGDKNPWKPRGWRSRSGVPGAAERLHTAGWNDGKRPKILGLPNWGGIAAHSLSLEGQTEPGYGAWGGALLKSSLGFSFTSLPQKWLPPKPGGFTVRQWKVSCSFASV